MVTKIKGQDLMLFVNGKSIACATSCDINISAETKDTSNKDFNSDWASEEVGKLSFSVSSSNLMVDKTGATGSTFDDLMSIMIAKQPVDFVFAKKKEAVDIAPTQGWSPNTAQGTTNYGGKIIITSLKVSASNGDIAKLEMSANGYGALAPINK